MKQVIKELTGGGVDYAFECVGNPKVMATAFASCQDVRATPYHSLARAGTFSWLQIGLTLLRMRLGIWVFMYTS